MPKRKRAGPPRVIPTSLTAAHAPPAGAGISDYSHLFNTYLAKIYKDRSKWKEPDLTTPEGEIVNEVAKKFNSTNTLGIGNATYKAAGPNSSSFYWVDPKGQSNLTLRPRTDLKYGPNPAVVGHELMHANDHQSNLPIDRLNPQGWSDLEKLATTGGAGGGSMNDFGEFGTSIGRIQDKIDIPGDFRTSYPIDESYIKKDIEGAVAGGGGSAPYTTPLTGGVGSAPNWPPLFADINRVITHPNAIPGGTPNQGFFLNRASEFPAFISENLTRHWGANSGANPLSLPEARFVHSTLGNMETAYPAADYPTMNSYIGQRRNSLAQAYYPPSPANPAGGPPGGVFSRGGRVTGKNLLSRFKKI